MTFPSKVPRRRVDGVLLLDKAPRMTSNDALQKARRLFNAAKAGHTGTLDPLATGLLPVCFGEATKFSSGLLEADKTYEALIRLGVTTTTADAEGEVLRTRPVACTAVDVEHALKRFRGPISQVPPMYSALKRDGKALYEYARQGIELAREARAVTIHRLDLLALDGDALRVIVTCSKGTYVRTLAEDIGEALGCGAHLGGLRRTAIGVLSVADALTLERLAEMDEARRDAHLAPLDALVRDRGEITLDAAAAARFRRGQSVACALPAQARSWRVYDAAGFLGVGRRAADGRLAPERLLAEAPASKKTGEKP